MECNFCKKIFTNKSSLNKHKLTTKYCLKIQGEISKNPFKCASCDKTFTVKQSLTIHEKTCEKINLEKEIRIVVLDKDKELIKKDIIIEQLQKQLQKQGEQIKELQDKLERLATTAISKPTTTNNNTKITFNNSLDLSHERIFSIVTSKLNGEHIVDGMAGIARFVKDEIITDKDGSLLYNCVDPSRQLFKFKNNNGDISKDRKASKLIGAIQPALKEKTNDLYFYYDNEIDNYVPTEEDKNNFFNRKDKYIFLKDTTSKIQDDIAEMHQNNKFTNELANLVTN
jgi:hypothetical protein